ncbi:MAG: serine hydrolase [Bacteroidota bacterium]
MRRLLFLCQFFLFSTLAATPTNSVTPPTKGKILFIVSNAHFYGNSKMNAANHFAEIVYPYDKLVKAGYTVDFVSPEGGAIPIGYLQTSDNLIKSYLYDNQFMDLLKRTHKPENLSASNYDAVYFGGGGAAMFGVPENESIQQIVMEVYEAHNGIVAAVCHGSAGLVNLKKRDGTYLVNGRKVNGFPDLFENKEAAYYKTFPFSIEEKLKARGANFVYSREGWDGFAVEDGRLITGQDPSAAGLVAEKMIAQLAESKQGRVWTPELEQKLDSFYMNWKDADKPGVAAGLLYNGEIVYLKGFGSADIASGRPITPNTPFQISSLSKQFTAFAVLLLAEQGKLNLSDDVRKYVPELPNFGKTITLEHLITQSSGLHEIWGLKAIGGWKAGDVFTQQDALKLICQQKELDFEPGTNFSMTASGLVLLAEVVTKVAEQSFAEFTKTAIFEPLGMTSTFFKDDHEMMIPNVAHSYQATENGHKKRILNNSMVGPTNLYTSVSDMCKWYLNFDNPKVGSPALIKKMETPVTLANGRQYKSNLGVLAYGQQYWHHERGLPMFWSYGLMAGYACNIFRVPEHGLTSFVLGNNNQYNGMPAMSMVYTLLKDEFPESQVVDFKNIKTEKLTTAQLNQFAGQYWHEEKGYGRRIFNKNDTLRYQHLGAAWDSKLVPLDQNTFQMVVDSDDKIYIKFENENGEMRMLTKSGESEFEPLEKYEPVSYDSEDLAQFSGTYYAEALGITYTLTVKDAQLLATNLRRGAFQFTPVKEDVFRGNDWTMQSIEFDRKESGEIAGFQITFDGISNLRFAKL